MMVTTMELFSFDKCLIVHDDICEHVIFTSGEALFDTLRNIPDVHNLPLDNCITNVFDGAASMCGQYDGVSKN